MLPDNYSLWEQYERDQDTSIVWDGSEEAEAIDREDRDD